MAATREQLKMRWRTDNGKKPVKQIVFQGERFDVESVLCRRERALEKVGQ